MIRFYGIKEKLNPVKGKLTDAINQCMADALSFPDNKRAHRFISMYAVDYYCPEGESSASTVIEISMIEARPVDVKKNLSFNPTAKNNKDPQ